MADALLNIDRLIEGQGQLFDLAVNTKIELDEVKTQLPTPPRPNSHRLKQRARLGARAVANLAVTAQRQFEELKAAQDLILQILRENLP